jgi:hypothetical protein
LALLDLTNTLLASPGDTKMSKLLTALIAGLFAASVFAADAAPSAPAAASTDTTSAAPAKKVTHKHHHKKHEKQASKGEAATPAK